MKSKIVLLIAIIFGLITSYLVFNYLQDIQTALDDNEYVEITVANQDLPAHTLISAGMVRMKKMPFQYIHSQEITNNADVIGKILLVPVNSGESIMKNQVIDQGDKKEGLAYLIPKGKRALTVPVDEVSGVAGLIKPGDKVDVISTITIGDENPVIYTLIVLQDIEVLATGKVMEQNADSKKPDPETKTVTLAVSLDQASPLMMANQQGVISLMLRSPIDDSKENTQPFIMEDFLSR